MKPASPTAAALYDDLLRQRYFNLDMQRERRDQSDDYGGKETLKKGRTPITVNKGVQGDLCGCAPTRNQLKPGRH